MASQLLRHIQKGAGRDNYVGNTSAGQFLVEKVFKPGARDQWNAMLKKATGEELNPEHWVGQFVGQN
jgi:peptidyl-dipeptidase A